MSTSIVKPIQLRYIADQYIPTGIKQNTFNTLTYMNLNLLLQKLNDSPETVEFRDTMSVIEAMYEFNPVAFRNGALSNEQGQNSGSCKLFSFAKLHGFTPQQTLECFGSYYRDDVLKNPEGADHQNIRNFMKTGWAGVHFSDNPLMLRHES